MEMDTSKPIAWKYVSLAILPGLVAFAIRSNLSGAILGAKVFQNNFDYNYSLTAVGIATLIIGIVLHRKITPGLFPAIGLLISILPGVTIDLLISLTENRSLHTPLANTWIAGAWGISIILFWLRRHTMHLPRYGWKLLGCAVLAAPFSLIVGGVLALPIAVGLLVAEKHRVRAGLIPLAGIYVWVDSLFDPSYFLPNPAATIVKATLVVAFLVVPVLWVLRAQSDTVALWGLVLPPSLGLLIGEIVRSISVSAPYDLSMWLIRGGGVLQFSLVLLVSAMLYRGDKYRTDNQPAIQATSGAG